MFIELMVKPKRSATQEWKPWLFNIAYIIDITPLDEATSRLEVNNGNSVETFICNHTFNDLKEMLTVDNIPVWEEPELKHQKNTKEKKPK